MTDLTGGSSSLEQPGETPKPTEGKDLLGVDPVVDLSGKPYPVPGAPSDEPAPAAPAVDLAAKVAELEGQLTQAKDAIKLVEMLNQDQGAMAALEGYFKGRSGQEPAAPEAPSPGVGDAAALRKELDETKSQLAGLAAMLAVRDFKSTTPDFEEYREDMHKLLNKAPGLTLEEAYQLAKSRRSAPSSPAPKPQGAEGRVTLAPSRPGDLSAIAKQIEGARSTREAALIAAQAAAAGVELE